MWGEIEILCTPLNSLNTEFYMGLTVHLGKLSLEDFMQIIREDGEYSNRFILIVI